MPGSIYRVVVEALRTSEPLTVSAALIRSKEQVTANKVMLKKGEITEILLMVIYHLCLHVMIMLMVIVALMVKIH